MRADPFISQASAPAVILSAAKDLCILPGLAATS